MTMQSLFTNVVFLLVNKLFKMYDTQNLLRYIPQSDHHMPIEIWASKLFPYYCIITVLFMINKTLVCYTIHVTAKIHCLISKFTL